MHTLLPFPLGLCLLVPTLPASAQPVSLAWAWAFDPGNAPIFHEADIATAPDGDVLVVGGFDQEVDMDPGSGTTLLHPFSGGEGFVLRLTADGDLRWAAPLGRSADVVAVNSTGDVFVAGNYLEGYDLDPGPAVLNVPIGAVPALYLAKLGAAGDLLWAHVFPCTGNGPHVSATVLAVAPDGSVSVGGILDGSIDLDPGPGDMTLTSAACNICHEGYLAHFAADGTFQWADRFRLDVPVTNGIMTPLDLAIDDAGRHYLTGEFNGTIDFDPGDGEHLDQGLTADSYVLKLDAAGAFEWMLPVGDAQNVRARCIGVVPEGDHVVIAAHFLNTADLAPGPGTSLHTAGGEGDVCLIALNGAGAFQWAAAFQGTHLEQVCDLHVSAGGEAYLLGAFSYGYLDLDPGPGNVEHSDKSSGFLTVLDRNGLYRWSVPLLTELSVFADARIAVNDAGDVHLTGRSAHGLDLDPGPGTVLLDAALSDSFVAKWNGTGTGLADAGATRFTLHPNPANEQAFLRALHAGSLSVQVIDGHGRILRVPVRKEGEVAVLTVAHLPDGLYLVRCTDGQRTDCARLQVVH